MRSIRPPKANAEHSSAPAREKGICGAAILSASSRMRRACLAQAGKQRSLAADGSPVRTAAIHRPLDAELVGEVAVMIAPELPLEGHGDAAAGRKCVEQRLA